MTYMMPPIVDMRLRPPIPAWTRGSVFRTAMHYPRKMISFKGARSAWLEDLDILFEEMDSSSIRYGVLIGRASSGAGNLGGVENREIVEAVNTYPDRFLGFLGVDLDDIDGGLAEIREFASEANIKGVSIEPGSAREPRWSDDPSLDPVYQAALEHDLPVSISLSGLLSVLGGHDITWSSPVSIQRVAQKYPDLKIIVSHAAWPYAAEMVVVAMACPNIYVSPDLYAATKDMICADTYVKGANMFLENQTLFGSAYPVKDIQEAVRDFLDMGWRQDIIPKILYGNAAKLLKLDLG
ncbi:amidohydrolase family protein [Microbaculum marinisediminis]|uniref:Amidohydrolase family protein n=1 Tax=Microbaculum marinisediminis TaxID=2931392 RepID=A0AAW5QTS9_9HYPH|nr:amidohydrolase family protein [Microbaculum sp. A6E488]MCT8971496.1 amidohydrolase family protein [Microbaculum sp. A6E488]